jgi:hypothetical protein
MDWQQLVSLAIVGSAAALLIWSKIRPRKFSFAKDTCCGCAANQQRAVPQHSVIFHARKGERPEVRVRMK